MTKPPINASKKFTLRIFRTADGYRVRDLTHGMWVSEAAGKAVAKRYLHLLTEAGYGVAE